MEGSVSMKRSIVTVTVVLWCLSALAWCQQLDQDGRAVVEASNAFSTQLYQALASETGNLVVSPLSVQVALAMAWLGARGETASQIAAGIHLPPTTQQVEAGFRSLITHLQGYSSNSNTTVVIDIANKLFTKQSLNIKEEFRSSVTENFLSEAQELDFGTDTENARRVINQWVEEKTKNKIKDLIVEGGLDANTVMVLVNAIYFHGSWLKAFAAERTTTELFHSSGSSSQNVDMMHMTEYFNYGHFRELKLSALQLPYSGDTFSMLLLLPDKKDGVSRLETDLASINFTHIQQRMRNKKIVASLPRFKIEKRIDLAAPLQQLGMTNMFGSRANFSGIADGSLYVSKVAQKAFVEVTEEGTEAAAATEIQTSRSSGPPRFNADHPFMFLILDNTSGAIIFMGRVAQPT